MSYHACLAYTIIDEPTPLTTNVRLIPINILQDLITMVTLEVNLIPFWNYTLVGQILRIDILVSARYFDVLSFSEQSGFQKARLELYLDLGVFLLAPSML